MNALANSQVEELDKFLRRGYPEGKVRSHIAVTPGRRGVRNELGDVDAEFHRRRTEKNRQFGGAELSLSLLAPDEHRTNMRNVPPTPANHAQRSGQLAGADNRLSGSARSTVARTYELLK
jgi:hypothetical protein